MHFPIMFFLLFVVCFALIQVCEPHKNNKIQQNVHVKSFPTITLHQPYLSLHSSSVSALMKLPALP